MRKEDNGKTRLCVQYDDHSRLMSTVLCSLMEHQSLVDLAIRCGNNTMHAHKCILAASSPYFREQLEKNPGTEQVIINGLDFNIMKSVIEFIYCGETNILEEHLKQVVAAAKLFQIRGLQALAPENSFDGDDSINIPAPIFMNKKPKYSSAYIPFIPITQQTTNNNTHQPATTNQCDNNSNSNNLLNNMLDNTNSQQQQQQQRRFKRKYVRTTLEAEKACAREARASRMALEALKKELGPTNQLHNFEIEDACTETTVENFIPHVDEHLQEDCYHHHNYEAIKLNSLMPFDANAAAAAGAVVSPDNKTIDKIRDVFCQEMQTNVEIMYKTPEGEFVKVTDEVLRNITGDTLQFQVIDENGREGEIQLLGDKIMKIKPSASLIVDEVIDVPPKKNRKFEDTFRDFINTTYSDAPQNPMLVQTADEEDGLYLLDDKAAAADSIKIDDIKLSPRVIGGGGGGDVKDDVSVRLLHQLIEPLNDDNGDILKEINSMQYYDKCVYEDVAEKYESAFQDDHHQQQQQLAGGQDRDMQQAVEDFDHVVVSEDDDDNILKMIVEDSSELLHANVGNNDNVIDCPIESLKKLHSTNDGLSYSSSALSDEETQQPMEDACLATPACYSPRKTRSNTHLLLSSSTDDLKMIRKSINKKK